MIPTWSSAFSLICALNPLNFFFLELATNAVCLFRVINFLLLNILKFLFAHVLNIGWIMDFLLFDIFCNFFCLFRREIVLNVFTHDSLEWEWVEKGSFGQRFNLLRVYGSNNKSRIAQLYDFLVLWDLCNFVMRICNCLNS